MSLWSQGFASADRFGQWVLERLGLWGGGQQPPYHIAQRPPLDVEAPAAAAPIAERLGVLIVEDDISVDGLLLPYAHPPTALVNRKHPKPKQAFSAAHELAHWLFISDDWHSDLRVRAVRTLPDEERRADVLAAALLMPRPWIVARRGVHGDDDGTVSLKQLAELADEAQVSLSACLLRVHHTSSCRAALVNLRVIDGRCVVVAEVGVPNSVQGRLGFDEDTQNELMGLEFGTHEDLTIRPRIAAATIDMTVDVRRNREGLTLLFREGFAAGAAAGAAAAFA